jgi:hypothetical protein
MSERPATPERAPHEAKPIDVRAVNDRSNIARMTRDALDVRCLGTLGGLAGVVVGFLVFGWVGASIGGAGVLLALVGIPLGWWVGVRTILGFLARNR